MPIYLTKQEFEISMLNLRKHIDSVCDALYEQLSKENTNLRRDFLQRQKATKGSES